MSDGLGVAAWWILGLERRCLRRALFVLHRGNGATAARDGVEAYVRAGQVYLIRRSQDDAMNMANSAFDTFDAHGQHFASFLGAVRDLRARPQK